MKVGDKECSGGHATGFETKSAQTDTRPVSRQRVLRRTRDRFRDKECSGGHATGFETKSAQADTRPVSRQRVLRRTRDRFR